MLPVIKNSFARNSRQLAVSRAILQSPRRTYADSHTPRDPRPPRPPLSTGGANQPIIIGLLVGIPVLALLVFSSGRRRVEDAKRADPPPPPDSDPAGTARVRKADAEGSRFRDRHPEHEHPDEYRPPFGQLHKAKRNDEPPDERNHQSAQGERRR
ncbi:hypothetical protein F5Y16DRAFT_355221 [Xylariaceae sp. FL0255]|nr:hypothetical protein F5Y16DRAFT_355221 [Xylariaceae sp. FL0255]